MTGDHLYSHRLHQIVVTEGLAHDRWSEPEWTGTAWRWHVTNPLRFYLFEHQAQYEGIGEVLRNEEGRPYIVKAVRFKLLLGTEKLPLANLSRHPGPDGVFTYTPSYCDRGKPITDEWLRRAWRWMTLLDTEWVEP